LPALLSLEERGLTEMPLVEIRDVVTTNDHDLRNENATQWRARRRQRTR
jgi:hypothetical protein